MSLTAKAVMSAKPKATPYRITDGGGLYLYVSTTGARSWRFDFTAPSGKRVTMAMGLFPDVSLSDARATHQEARRKLARGIDPRKPKADSLRTFAALADAVIKARSSPPAVATLDARTSRLSRHVLPYIGGADIASIKAADVRAVCDRVADLGKAETAHRILRDIGEVMLYAIAEEMIDTDVTTGLKRRYRSPASKNFGAPTTPAALAPILRAIWGYQGDVVTVTALKLAPMLLARAGELRAMRWAGMDLEAAEWRFTAPKTNTARIVPLPRQAVALLADLRPLTGRGEYVFPSARTRDGSRPISENTLNAAMRRMGIKGDEATTHGFRATARTIMAEVLGVPAHLIEHQLGHAVRDVNGTAYNRTTFLPERRELLQRWADFMDEIASGE